MRRVPFEGSAKMFFHTMYTECPTCRSLYLLHAKVADTMGIAYCPNCKYVFDAVASLRSEARRPRGVTPSTFAVGDRQVLRSSIPLAQPWRSFEPAAQTAPPPASVGLDGADAKQGESQSGFGGAAQTVRLLFGLGIRNLLRNRKRTIVALGAIGFGVISLLLAGAFMEWVFWATRESSIQGKLGHIQVNQEGYLEKGVADPFAYLISDDDPARALIEAMPHVVLLAPRLAFTGLLSKGETSISFIGEGVDPKKEAKLSIDFRIVAGENLGSNDEATVILGSGLARAIEANPGDTVTLLGKTVNGSLNAVQLRVAGLFETTNKVWNETTLRVPRGKVEQLIRGSGAQSWAVLLDETERTDEVLEALRRSASSDQAKIEFVPWYVQTDFYNKTVALYKRQMNVVRFVIALIIMISISNMLAMNVMERTSEIGTLMATGFKRGMILRLFVGEGLLLGLIGGIVGTAAGIALAELISWVGIPMPPAPGMDRGFTAEMRLTWPLIILGPILAIVTTLIASIVPARKAASLQIVDALRQGK